ncbi:MAG: cadherin-like beta sandwich domain-containing protein, partial [Chitinispirillaceae bacterium]|nr:cadherin-like beta sandwich domain-containing protein [Chitinispirillaceae bacterium]
MRFNNILFFLTCVGISFLLSCELPYPAPQTEANIIVYSNDGSVYIKDNVFYDTVSKEFKLGFNITHCHRVDSIYFWLTGKEGQVILSKSWHKSKKEIVGKDSINKIMEWDTIVILTCAGKYEAQLKVYLDNRWEKEKRQKIEIIGAPVNLQKLILEGVNLEPLFSDDIYNYKVVVENNVSTVKIVPYLSGECVVITVNEDTVRSGAGKEIELRTGKNIIEVKSIVSDKEQKYLIEAIRRESKEDSRLLSLEIVGVTLNPSFDGDIDSGYYVEIGSKVDSLEVVAKSRNEKARIVVGEDSGAGELRLKEAISYGRNEIIIKVMSEDSSNVKEYRVVIFKKGEIDNRLRDLVVEGYKIAPEFNPDSGRYRVLVGSSDSLVRVNVSVMDNRLIVIINGEKTREKEARFTKNIDSVKIEVMSEDGSQRKEYVLIIERLKSDEARLTELKTEGFDLFPKFDSNNLKYRVFIQVNDSIVKVIATPKSNRAKIEIAGEKVKEKILKVTTDIDSVKVKVMSEDESKTMEY